MPRPVAPSKVIRTLQDLEEFTYAIIRAHGDMITTDEAIDGLRLAFREFEKGQRDAR